MSADQQRAMLQDLAAFSFSGRAAVAGQDAMPTVQWRQQQDVARVKLAGPWGVGGLQIHYSAQQLQLKISRGVKVANAEAEQLLTQELGFVPPFDALRYWVLGLPAPGAQAATETRDAAGLLQQLEQHDWEVRYQRHVAVNTKAGTLQLPAKLTATRDGLRLTLVIDRWQLK